MYKFHCGAVQTDQDLCSSNSPMIWGPLGIMGSPGVHLSDTDGSIPCQSKQLIFIIVFATLHLLTISLSNEGIFHPVRSHKERKLIDRVIWIVVIKSEQTNPNSHYVSDMSATRKNRGEKWWPALCNLKSMVMPSGCVQVCDYMGWCVCMHVDPHMSP